MTATEIENTIEGLCESLVLADGTDAAEMAGVQRLLEKVIIWADQQPETRIARAVSAAADLLEKVIFNDVDDVQASLNVIGETASALQAFICAEIPITEITFPAEMEGELEGEIATVDGASDKPITEADEDNVQQTVASSGGVTQEDAETEFSGEMLTVQLPSNVDKSIFADFLSMQKMSLEEMETLILNLESGDENILAEFRRMLHTLKGESGLLGLADVERLCHATEDAMDERDPKTIVDTLLGIKDWFEKIFNAYAGMGKPPVPVEQILATLKNFAPSDGSPEIIASNDSAMTGKEQQIGTTKTTATLPEHDALTGDTNAMKQFVIATRKQLDVIDVHLLAIETTPDDDKTLSVIFDAFHHIRSNADHLQLGQIADVSQQISNFVDKAREKKIALTGLKLDVVFDAVSMIRGLMTQIEEALKSKSDTVSAEGLHELLGRIGAAGEEEPTAEADQMLGEIMVDSGIVTEDQVSRSLGEQSKTTPEKPVGELLVSDGAAAAKDVGRALRSQKAAREKTGTVEISEKVKVDSQRLDVLVDTIGELVIAEAMVIQAVDTNIDKSGKLTRLLNQLDKITRELQNMATSMRMVPMHATFQRMARLVREVAKKTNKQVEFVMSGEETELDKSVVDLIKEPLIHMVRNAVDHGIETVGERREAGKPDVGKIELKAFHKGGSIYIEVCDDGKGLDKERILKKAIKKNLIREDDNLTENEIYNLIFTPGFSTATVVSDISGRGVGMDVVRKAMHDLRGQIEIISEKDKGSVFSIRLPLTLAIIEGMVVRVASERFIIPTLSIVRMVQPVEEDISTVFDRGRMLRVGEDLIPLYHLGELFNVDDAIVDPCKASVIVLEYDEHKAALIVDELMDQQQIVIKPLGESLKNNKSLAGGAIMPDGRVGLIIDVGGLIKMSQSITHADKQQPAHIAD